MVFIDRSNAHVDPPSANRKSNTAVQVVAGLMLGVVLVAAPPLDAQTVVGSRHDLSSSSGYSDQVCAFCHTPHFANADVVAPLWNRFVDLSLVFTTYQSPTMDTVPGQPTLTISGVCLGCHDGTIGWAVVNGITGSTAHDLVNAPGPGGMPDTTSWPNCRNCHGEIYGDPPADWQGTDLSNDHPITMSYPTAAEDSEFRVPPDPARGWSDVVLFDGKVECPTCHLVHDPSIVPFMRKPNVASQLCLTCHIK